MEISVQELAVNDLGSRQGGIRFRTELEHLLEQSPDQPLVLDFDGIRVMSSSFADEVFGRLFLRMGAVEFMSRLQLSNANRTVDALIDRAIVLRSQAGEDGTGMLPPNRASS